MSPEQISEIEKFELQTAKKVWDTLNEDDRRRLLVSPIYKIQEIKDMRYVGPYLEQPELSEVIRLRLMQSGYAESYGIANGQRSGSFMSPAYVTTAFGECVKRYGQAATILELATERQ